MRKKNPRLIKFNQPSVDGLHPRQRLLTHLHDQVEKGRSVWIGAPPGAGKTSLAASFAAQHRGPVIWFRMEPGDREASTFIRNLHLAVGRKPPSPDPFDEALPSLQATLLDITHQLADNTLWVWDSCEQLAAESPHFQALADLIKHASSLPPMLFTSREQPPPVFRSLQVAQKLAPVGWESMRLDPEETAAISRLVARHTASDAEHWHDLSGGWVAALVLLAQGNQHPQPVEGEWTDGLFDYLASEMLQRMTTSDRQWLMQLALLPCVPAEVAGAMLNDPQADSHLQQMANQWHLFEKSDTTPPVYRFHPLLKRFMLEQLEKHHSQHEIDAMRRQGADSLHALGLREEACELRLQAGDWQALLEEALTLAESLSAAGRLQTLESWLLEIPPEVAAQSAWHPYWLGYCLRFDRPSRGWPLLESAFNRFRDQNNVQGQYASWLAIVEAMMVVFEDLKPLKRWLAEYDALRDRHPNCPDKALKLKSLTLAGSVMSVVAPDHPKLSRLIRVAEIGVRLVPFRTPRQAAFTYLILHYANTGQIARMHAMARHLLPHLEESALPGPLRLFAHAMIGLHQIIAGDEAPEKMLSAAISLSNRIGGGMFSTIPRNYLIYYEIISGRLDGARKSLRQLEAFTPPNHRMYQAAHDFTSAWLEIAGGNSGKGLELSELSKQMCYQLDFDFGLALNVCLRAQAMTSIGDYAVAEEELAELGALARSSGSKLLLVMHGLADSWLLLRRDSEAAARDRLAPTLHLAEQEGILAYPGFLRQVTAELALVAVRGGLAAAFVSRLVNRWQLLPDALSPLETAWPWALRVHTLGRFEVSFEAGQQPGFKQSAHRRPLELLACLISLGGRDVPKNRLSDRLWPDTEADKANHALDNLLYRLRKLIGGKSLQVDSSLVSLSPSHCWVDSWALESLAKQTTEQNLPLQQAADLLLQIYQGEFLLGEEQLWLTPERERLRSRFLHLAETLGSRLVAEGDDQRAMQLWESALKRDPLAEGLYLQMMKCFADNGRQIEALAIYRRCCKTLAQAQGLEPGNAIQSYAESLGG